MMDMEKQNARPKKKKEWIVQVFFGLIANLVSIAPGMSLGFSAVALPALQNPNASFQVGAEEASWIASIASISTPIGCIITGSMLERFGRRITLIVVNIPCLLGWILIACARGESTLMMIYAGRFFTGLATGMACVPGTVYSAEMASESLRGMFITWTSIFMSLGIMIMYVLGYLLQDNWRMLATVSAVFPATSLTLVYFFLPETPSWLLSKGRVVQAEENLKKLRGVSTKLQMPFSLSNEFELMGQKYIKNSSEKPNKSNGGKHILKIFFRAGTIKPFVIMNLFFFFQQFSGIFVVIFYAVNIVIESGVTWDPYIVTILIGAFRVIISIFMSYISKRYGRRPPSIVSGAGMTICMAVLATYLYLKSNHHLSAETAAKLDWIPAVSLILHIMTSTIGFLTLPWAMLGEVFPSEVRGLAAGLTTCVAYIFNFIIVKLYPDMVLALKDYGIFFFYGTFAVIGTLFVILFLPETQGKTLLEIEEYFTKGKEAKTEKNKSVEVK